MGGRATHSNTCLCIGLEPAAAAFAYGGPDCAATPPFWKGRPRQQLLCRAVTPARVGGPRGAPRGKSPDPCLTSVPARDAIRTVWIRASRRGCRPDARRYALGPGADRHSGARTRSNSRRVSGVLLVPTSRRACETPDLRVVSALPVRPPFLRRAAAGRTTFRPGRRHPRSRAAGTCGAAAVGQPASFSGLVSAGLTVRPANASRSAPAAVPFRFAVWHISCGRARLISAPRHSLPGGSVPFPAALASRPDGRSARARRRCPV